MKRDLSKEIRLRVTCPLRKHFLQSYTVLAQVFSYELEELTKQKSFPALSIDTLIQFPSVRKINFLSFIS